MQEYVLKLQNELGGNDPRKVANGGGGGNGSNLLKIVGKGNRDINRELDRLGKTQKKSLGATLGIKFGTASLLKQSQVFTGFVGTIFQLMGALVDVILAPFLPILIPGIKNIAQMIPYVAKYAQAIYDFLDRTIFQWFRSFPLSDKIKDGVKAALSAILVGVVLLRVTGLWRPFATLVTTFIGKPLWEAMKVAGSKVVAIFDALGGRTVVNAVKAGAKGAITAVWDSTGGVIWRAITGAVDTLILRVWTQGLKATFVTPFLNRITGIAGLISRPFATLWASITSNITTAGDSFIGRALSAVRGMPLVSAILDIPHVITRYMEAGLNWLVNLPFMGVIRNLVSTLRNFIVTDIPQMIARLPIVVALARFLEASLKKLLEKTGGLLGKAVGAARGAFGFVKGKVQDTVAPKLMQGLGKIKPSHLLNAAKGLKAVPVIGAFAEAAFGGYAVYKDYKKYGAKAAAGRLALTMGNVTTALFDPTGLASAAGSIGTNIAMDQAYKRLLDPKDSWKRDNPDIWVEQADPMTGEMMWQKRVVGDNNTAAKQGMNNRPDRITMEE